MSLIAFQRNLDLRNIENFHPKEIKVIDTKEKGTLAAFESLGVPINNAGKVLSYDHHTKSELQNKPKELASRIVLT